MVDIISAIIVNVLTALYQSFGFSILMSVLAMYFYLFASDKEAAGQGTKKSIYIWISYFRSSARFRKFFFLHFIHL